MGGVRSCCLQLEESRVTARKAAEDQLRALLNNPRVCAQLDRASALGGGVREWTWQDVYRSTMAYLRLEKEKLVVEETKEKQSKNAAALRQQKRQAVLGSLRLVLGKGRAHLAWGTVVADLLDLLDLVDSRRLFAAGVARLLVEVLGEPLVRAMVTVGEGATHQWARLLAAVGALVEDAPPGLEATVVCRLLHLTMLHGARYSCLHAQLAAPPAWRLVRRLLLAGDDFCRPESEARLETIRAGSALVRAAAREARAEAAALGEATLQAVLRSWGDKREVQEVVVEFLELQLAVHHPLGATREEEGAFWGDGPLWGRQLARAWCNVVESTVRSRCRQARTARAGGRGQEVELEGPLVGLAVRLARQLLTSPTAPDMADVTQLVALDTTQGAPQAKRRRMASADCRPSRFTLDTLIGEVGGGVEGRVEGRVPWVQILASLLHRHPDTLGEEQGEQLLRLLSNLLQVSLLTKCHKNTLTLKKVAI